MTDYTRLSGYAVALAGLTVGLTCVVISILIMAVSFENVTAAKVQAERVSGLLTRAQEQNAEAWDLFNAAKKACAQDPATRLTGDEYRSPGYPEGSL